MHPRPGAYEKAPHGFDEIPQLSTRIVLSANWSSFTGGGTMLTLISRGQIGPAGRVGRSVAVRSSEPMARSICSRRRSMPQDKPHVSSMSMRPGSRRSSTRWANPTYTATTRLLAKTLPDGGYRIDIPNPRELNLRMPSGNEAGANEFWIPGGKLPTGNLEAVIDADNISPSQYTVTPIDIN